MGAVRKLWAKLCRLAVSGLALSKRQRRCGQEARNSSSRETRGVCRTGSLLTKSHRRKSKRRREEGCFCFHKPCLRGSEKLTTRLWPGTNLYEPRTRWPPPAVGWAEMVQAWQRLSSQYCAKGLMWQEVTGRSMGVCQLGASLLSCQNWPQKAQPLGILWSEAFLLCEDICLPLRLPSCD